MRYVTVLDTISGERLLCSDRYRDEWTGHFSFAESFGALHEAIEVANRHGGRTMTWDELHTLEATG